MSSEPEDPARCGIQMPAQRVQFSLEQELVKRIDRDPETRAHGRSAFMRSAVLNYLRAKERRQADQAIRRAYEGKADEMLGEVEALIREQAWPET